MNIFEWHWFANYTTGAKAMAAVREGNARPRSNWAFAYEFKVGAPNPKAPPCDDYRAPTLRVIREQEAMAPNCTGLWRRKL